MGYLSNLAKEVADETDDDKAAAIIRRKVMPPPPARPIEMVTPPPPVVPIMPPPTRVPIDAEPPPPLSAEDHAIATMEGLARQSRETLANADYSSAGVSPAGELTNIRFPTRLPYPTRPIAPEGVPEPIATKPITPGPPPRVFVGESHKGMNATQRAATHLRVLQDAAPESRVRDTGEAFEVDPPKKMGRIEGAGKGLLSLLTSGAPYGVGGMAGSGIFGAILGAVNPRGVQKIARAGEVGRAQEDYANNLALDQAGLENESRRLANMTGVARLEDADQDRALSLEREINTQYKQGLDTIGDLQKRQQMLDPQSPQYAAAEKAIQEEAAALSKRTGRRVTVIPGNPQLNQLPRMEVDGTAIQQQYDNSWKVIYGTPKSDVDADNADLQANYKWQQENTDNEAKRSAALQEAEALRAEAVDRQSKVTSIATQISTLDAQMAKMSKRDPALGPLQRQRQQLKEMQATQQKGMEDAYRKADEKKAEAAKYPTMPPPPKRVRRGQSATAATQSLSKSKWLAANPGGDWNAAQAEANRRQIPIIP